MKTKRREKIFEKGEGQCYLCQGRLKLKGFTVDHKNPRCDGGSNKLENLSACCETCNKFKGWAECILPTFTLTTTQKNSIMRVYRYFLRLKFDKNTQEVKRKLFPEEI